MPRPTQHDIDITLRNLKKEAYAADLVPSLATLYFTKPNRANGIAAGVFVERLGSHATFIPRFNHTQSLSEVLAILDGITYALAAINYNTRHGRNKS